MRSWPLCSMVPGCDCKRTFKRSDFSSWSTYFSLGQIQLAVSRSSALTFTSIEKLKQFKMSLIKSKEHDKLRTWKMREISFVSARMTSPCVTGRTWKSLLENQMLRLVLFRISYDTYERSRIRTGSALALSASEL